MGFTDIFIKRPVLSSVLSLLIFILGFVGILKMPLQQYPTMNNTNITVTTFYPGASAKVVQAFITSVLSRSIGSANGIDYLSSSSSLGTSKITAHIKLNYNPDAALTEITGKVNAALSLLPKGVFSPTITRSTGSGMPELILGFSSERLSQEEISAYLSTVFRPSIFSVGGISRIELWGEKQYAMRIWLDPQKIAVQGVTPQEVSQALLANNVQATPGQLKTNIQFFDLGLTTDLHDADAFNDMVIKNDGGHQIKIRDIGEAKLSAADLDHRVTFQGEDGVFVAVFSAPGVNPLSMVKKVQQKFHQIAPKFPPNLKGVEVYNATLFIENAINDVIKTILEASLIVIIVIFCFIGSVRTVMIPVITIPLSLVGACFMMIALGFSLNLMTLLAMVLAIGLVVDDAIVVVENIYHHIEAGKSPIEAALAGAREIKGPVIVMTLTLAAVYAPIGFIGGLTGALFTEFAFTLAGAVVISGIVALTLSPMLCSRIISRETMSSPLVQRIDRISNGLADIYERALTAVLDYRKLVIGCAFVTLALCFVFIKMIPEELAPKEDNGFVGVIAQGPGPANINFLAEPSKRLDHVLASSPATKMTFAVLGNPTGNGIFAGTILKPWDQRTITSQMLVGELQKNLAALPNIQAFAFQPPPLPGMPNSAGIDLVLKSTVDHEILYGIADQFMDTLRQTGLFVYMNKDLKYNFPEYNMKIDRPAAAALGIQMQDIAQTFSTLVSGGLINYFSLHGYAFSVIPQVPQAFRDNPQVLSTYPVKSKQGNAITLSDLLDFKLTTKSPTLNQFQQLNSVTVSLMLRPGLSQGAAIAGIEAVSDKLPSGVLTDYAGSARAYLQEGNAMVYTFCLALIIIFLVLAAQFESFRDPFIILVSVPLSVFGALLPLFLGAATLNIYTEIGLVTLIGLISKHGILIVEFANKLQINQGISRHDAVILAAKRRLRPILMTTAAMVFGVVPLVLATGAGGVSRNNVGLVIFFGMLIGTCFTLFLVPTVYTLLGSQHHHDHATAAPANA